MIIRLSTALALCAFSAAAAQTADSASQKSVQAGVYTDEQATKGDNEHQANCSGCHDAAKYSGEAFTKNWLGRTVFDLFDQIKTTMPDDNPGGLSVQQYTDIVAYILKINGFPAGTEVLPSDPEALRVIKIEAKAPGGTSDGRRAHAAATPIPRPVSAPYHPHAPQPRSARR